MSFVEAVRTCFQKYVSIEGRARRSEYWWFLLFVFLGNLVLSGLDRVFFGPEMSVLGTIFALGVLLPAICVGIRRLHDRDLSGWWILLNLIPLIGALVLMVIYALPGTVGRNRFGPSPLSPGGHGPGSDDDDSTGYSPSSIPRAGHE